MADPNDKDPKNTGDPNEKDPIVENDDPATQAKVDAAVAKAVEEARAATLLKEKQNHLLDTHAVRNTAVITPPEYAGSR